MLTASATISVTGGGSSAAPGLPEIATGSERAPLAMVAMTVIRGLAARGTVRGRELRAIFPRFFPAGRASTKPWHCEVALEAATHEVTRSDLDRRDGGACHGAHRARAAEGSLAHR